MNSKEFIALMEDMEYGEKMDLYFKDRDQHARVTREPDGKYWIMSMGSLAVIVDRFLRVYDDDIINLYNYDTFIGNMNTADVESGKVM